jgi:hypothetical protein
MACAICYEDMDMAEFKDPRQSTITCYKLACEHAYHTSCIIRCLKNSRHECPLCNTIKPPEILLNNEGFARKILHEVLRIPEIVHNRKELFTSRELLLEKKRQLKKDVTEYAKKRAEELKINDHRIYFSKCLIYIKNLIKKYCIELGNVYVGAYFFQKEGGRSRYRKAIIDQIILREQRVWMLYNLQSSRIYVNFSLLSKHKNESNNPDSDGDNDLSLHLVL